MSADIDHDGVTWRVGGSPILQASAIGAIGALLVAGVAFGTAALLFSAGLSMIPLLVFLQVSRRETVRVTLRCVIVETRDLLGRRTRVRVPLDEIRDVRVASSSSGDFALVVGTGAGRYRIAPREPQDQLEWLAGRIEHARALFAEHERQEGREWTFLRKVPNALGELIERKTDDPEGSLTES